MRKIILSIFVSLDGVIQAPGGPEEDTTNGFKWGGWVANHWDTMMNETMGAAMSQSFDLLLGRRTYEIFAAHWPYMKDDPIGGKFNNVHKYAVSSKPLKVDWANTTLITGDVVAGLRELKKQKGPDLLIFGSSKLVQTLLANGLIDQLHLWTFPVTIGTGKRLFEEGTQPASWNLVDSKASTTGVVISFYEPAGELKPGSVADVAPSAAELERRKRWEKGDA